MLSRNFLVASARYLFRQVGFTPVVSLESQRTLSRSLLPASYRAVAAPFSSTCVLKDTPNKPGKSGDRGPEKNYRKKVLKKQKKEMVQQKSAPDLSVLLEGMKVMESQGAGEAQSVPAGHIASLMKGRGSDRSGARRSAAQENSTEGKYSAGRNVQQPNRGNHRHQQSGPRKVVHPMDSRLPKLRGKGMESPVNFTDPSSGKRLGLFNRPKPGTKVMPPAKPTLAEQDELKGLQELFLLKPTTHYEEQMVDTMTASVRYPRTFPIDNDDYYKNHIEASTGFEEHVLLDHLLEGFPKRGPVRHFMELVVTGLSKNPHYTASEKRQCVEWYREYFNEFTSKELQSL